MQERKPRQIARELALLSLSQLPANPKKLTEEQLPKQVNCSAVMNVYSLAKPALVI